METVRVEYRTETKGHVTVTKIQLRSNKLSMDDLVSKASEWLDKMTESEDLLDDSGNGK
jgi:hypothetical protein